MSWKDVSISTFRRRLCEAGLYGRISIRKPLLWKQNNVKSLQCDQGAQRLDNSVVERSLLDWRNKFRILLEKSEGLCATKSWWKSFYTPYHTSCKAWRIYYGSGGFCQSQSRELAPCEGQIELDRLSQHTGVSSWCMGCPRGLMVKAMNCGIVVREFVLQSRYYVHFRANTLGKGMNPFILPPAMGK